MTNLHIHLFPPIAEELYGVEFSLYEFNEEKEDDILICKARGHIFNLFEEIELLNQVDAISGDLEFVASVIVEQELVEYDGNKLFILDEVSIVEKQANEIEVFKVLIEEIQQFLEEFAIEYIAFMHEAFYKTTVSTPESDYFNLYKQNDFEHRLNRNSRQYVFFKSVY